MRVMWTVAVWGLLMGGAAAAQQDKWTAEDAVSEALAANPEIAAAARGVDAARQRTVESRSLPDPMLSAGYNSSGRPWPGAGLGSEPTANIGFMVRQALPFPGKRALRTSIADHDASAMEAEVDAARLSITSRVKQAYFRLAYSYAAIDVLTRNQALLETLLAVSENRYAVGSAAQQDVIKAQTQVSILALQLARLQQERASREEELNALRARPAGTPVPRPDDLQITAVDFTLDQLIAGTVDHAPALRRDRILIDRGGVAVDAARRDYRPDFAVSGGYSYMGSMPPMYEVRFDVDIPLQRARRAAAVSEQRSLLEQARQTYDADRLALQGRISEEFRNAAASTELARLYRDTVLPQARLALESSIASYETGGVDFLSVLTNFGTALEYEMRYFDELASYHTAVSRLEEMSGMPLAH